MIHLQSEILELKSTKHGLARGTIYLQMKEGTFPQSIKLGKKRVVWTTESIQKWLDQLVEKNGRMLD